ncbi:MAG TPA: 2-amino-4-hydroxy-6-hydroxymethyldihydropteridine diphosphokinase [Sulfurovum sp.]|uniref:2-amino-4-hydroxy-6- hydroxymethyldihydropteridine diphosphokinase n=1 Tax=Sulfurovum sp. TaxID=1969726 RepID=UPI002F951A4F
MITKKLNDQHTLIRTAYFPCSLPAESGHPVLLGIGGNVGDVVRRFEHLYHYLKRSSLVRIIETAPILKNPPFGFTEQEDFYNSLIVIETLLRPKALLRYVLRVEKIFGRKRLFKDGPRTLDIDIIFYDNVAMETKDLTLPHPGWRERDSVLVPMQYLSNKADFRHQAKHW